MAKTDQIPTVQIDDARIMFCNFEGRPGKFNRDGDRNFCVLLDEDIAQAMMSDGWNIKRLKPREDDEGELPEGTPYIQVSVKYTHKPPRIVLISSAGRTELTEDLVEMLDTVDIAKADLILNPYSWELPDGSSGVKAYLKTLFVIINEDELEKRYAGFDDPFDKGSEE